MDMCIHQSDFDRAKLILFDLYRLLDFLFFISRVIYTSKLILIRYIIYAIKGE